MSIRIAKQQLSFCIKLRNNPEHPLPYCHTILLMKFKVFIVYYLAFSINLIYIHGVTEMWYAVNAVGKCSGKTQCSIGVVTLHFKTSAL